MSFFFNCSKKYYFLCSQEYNYITSYSDYFLSEWSCSKNVCEVKLLFIVSTVNCSFNTVVCSVKNESFFKVFLKKLCQSPAIVRRKMNIDWGYLHQGDQHRSWMQLQKYRSFYKYWKLLGSNLFTYYFYDNFILEMIYSISSIMDSFIKIIKSHFFKKKHFLRKKIWFSMTVF